MPSLNKVTLIGHCGRDPEMKYTSNGKALCRFSIATSEKWKDKNDAWQENTEWHNIVIWGPSAERANDRLQKGVLTYVEGKIKSRDYEDQSGNKRKSFEIHADRWFALEKAGGNGQGRSYSPPPDDTPDDNNDDDLPF